MVNSRKSHRSWRIARSVFGLVGAGFLAWVFLGMRENAVGMQWPSAVRVAVAFVLSLASLYAGFSSWHALLPDSDRRSLASAFFVSQLGKYIPGAVWQGFAQAGLSVDAGVSSGRAIVALPVHVVVNIAAGAGVGSLLGLLAPAFPIPGYLLLLVGFSLPVIALRRVMVSRFVGLVARFVPKIRQISVGELVPSQLSLVHAYFWSLLSIAMAGVSFAVVALSVVPTSAGWSVNSLLLLMAGFGLAWTVGYLVVPVPSGIGVREGVLILTCASLLAPEQVVSSSLIHRIVTIAAEVVIILGATVSARTKGLQRE